MMDANQSKTDDFVSRATWRAQTLPSWRGNASGILLVAGIFIILIGGLSLPLTWDKPGLSLFELSIPLFVFGILLMLVGFFVHARSTVEWTLAGRTLRCAARSCSAEFDLSGVRVADIADRLDGTCDLHFYLIPGGRFDCFAIERLRPVDAEAALVAFHRCGVEIAPANTAPPAFPDWMTPRERRIFAFRLGRGERLLWVKQLPLRDRIALWTVYGGGGAIIIWWLVAKYLESGTADERFAVAFASGFGVFLAIVLLPALGIRLNSISYVPWITNRLIVGLSGPGGRFPPMSPERLTEPPILIPRSPRRTDLFVLPHDIPSLASLPTHPHPRRHAIGYWNLSPAEAEAVAAVLRELRRGA